MVFYGFISKDKLSYGKALSNDLVSHDFLDPVEKFFVEKCKNPKMSLGQRLRVLKI